MKTIGRVSSGFAVAALACLFALACALALPMPAHAVEVGELTISQAFTTTGTVPDTVTGTFTYELAASDDAPLPGTGAPYRFTLAGDGAHTVLPLEVGPSTGGNAWEFTHAGQFEYDLRCTSDGGGGLKVDATRYHVTVSIVNDSAAAGGLRLQSIIVTNVQSGDKVDQIMFRHAYHGSAASVTTADLLVKKIIAGKTPARTAAFHFTLTPGQASYPMPEGTSGARKTIQVFGAGEAGFGSLRFTEPGTYGYTITEVDDGLAGYAYDKSTYRITYTVSARAGGMLDLVQTVAKDGKAVSESKTLDFTNRYNGEPPTPGQWIAGKFIPLTGDSLGMLIVLCIVLCVSIGSVIIARVAVKRHRHNE